MVALNIKVLLTRFVKERMGLLCFRIYNKLIITHKRVYILRTPMGLIQT